MARFRPKRPFAESAFPDAERPFPIVEVFGHHRSLASAQARRAFNDRRCPFANTACEKFRQYGFGYCSVSYRTAWDDSPWTYAVCDHRLDGTPIRSAMADFFGECEGAVLVPEVVLTKPRQSFDFIGLDPKTNNFCGIESQAIDLRGGGVGPAFQAILDGRPEAWRSYFAQEASDKGRKDNVAYGVNMANIYKRLGLQIAEKGALLRALGSKLYVVVQDRPFQYLERRVRLQDRATEDEWDITFLTFEYTGRVSAQGILAFDHRRTVRTSIGAYAAALVEATAAPSRSDFLKRIRKKAGLKL